MYDRLKTNDYGDFRNFNNVLNQDILMFVVCSL